MIRRLGIGARMSEAAIHDGSVAGHTPPHATVQAALARPAWKVEIVATAAGS